MKTTLENSYCVPNDTEKATLISTNLPWVNLSGRDIDQKRVIARITLGNITHLDHPWPCDVPYLTEIPVQHFIDLLEDRIVPWRLEEFGFKELVKCVWSWSDDGHQILISFEPELDVMLSYSDQGMIPLYGCQTFTDLLTLIQFLK